MTFNWKMAAIAAAGCFLLSFVTGLFAQVHFGWLLLRALLMALLGGALAIALRWLVLKFLPELTEGVGGGERAAMADTGSKVDIVVSDEAGRGGEAAEEEGEPETLAAATAREESGDFAEELEELKASPILAPKEDEGGQDYQPVKPPEVIEDVDVLPDLESFQDAFAIQDLGGEGGAEGAAEDSAPRMGSGSGSGSRGGSEAMNDSETIAQAIRTALHRDKKG